MKKKITNFLKVLRYWFVVVWFIAVVILPFYGIHTIYQHNKVINTHKELNQAVTEKLEILDSLIYFMTIENNGENK